MNRQVLANLSDVAYINPKLKAPLHDSDVVSFLGMANISEWGTTEQGKNRAYSAVRKGFTPFEDGDILMAKITPCFENGKIAQARIARSIGFGSTEFHVIRPREKVLDPRYLLHFLRLKRIRIEGESRMTGSGGQRRVPINFLQTLQIPLPALPEQRRIAAILDEADQIRARRAKSIQFFQEIKQSMFVEFFGLPHSQTKWQTGRIGDMLVSANYGTSEKSLAAGRYPVLRMNNISYDGRLDLRQLKYMELDESKVERFTVTRGDVLFNRTNSPELVGKTALYDQDDRMAFAGYLVRLRVSAAHEPQYLASFLNTEYAKRVLRSMCKSIVGMANINAKEVQSISIPLPPLARQKEFSKAVSVIDSVRSIHIAAAVESKALFESLHWNAFNGQLERSGTLD